jgi:hypothetical protein
MRYLEQIPGTISNWRASLRAINVSSLLQSNTFALHRLAKKYPTSIPSLLVPPNSSVPNPGSLTSDPQEIQQILFEFQSGLCKASSDYEGFDPMFFANTLQTVSDYPSSEVGPGFCERTPTTTEPNMAVDTLCNYKAAGLDLLFNECLKAGNLAMRESLTSLSTGLWKL